MEHLIEGVADDEKFFCVLSHSEGVVETSIEEGILCVKPQYFPVIERIGQIVLHKLLISLRIVHLFALLDEPILGGLHIDLIIVQIGQAVDVISVGDEFGFIFYLQFHEIW